jgi:hypothetical protein
VLDLALDGDTDRQKATAVLLAAASSVTKSKEFVDEVLAEPEVWGVQAFNGDEVVLRLVIKVDHRNHDAVARALREQVLVEVKKSKIALSSGRQSVFVKLGK